jgi:hypothetical protein
MGQLFVKYQKPTITTIRSNKPPLAANFAPPPANPNLVHHTRAQLPSQTQAHAKSRRPEAAREL